MNLLVTDNSAGNFQNPIVNYSINAISFSDEDAFYICKKVINRQCLIVLYNFILHSAYLYRVVPRSKI